MRSTDTFRFEPVTLSDIQNEIKNLNPNKVTTHNNISPKIFRSSQHATANVLQFSFNDALSNSVSGRHTSFQEKRSFKKN